MMREGSMSGRILRAGYRQGWVTARELGDMLDMPSAVNDAQRNTLSVTLTRLVKRELVEQRIGDLSMQGVNGSKYEYRVHDDYLQRMATRHQANAAKWAASARTAACKRWPGQLA